MWLDLGLIRAWTATWRGLLRWHFGYWSRIDLVCGDGFEVDAVTGEIRSIPPSTTAIKGSGFALGPFEISRRPFA